MKVSFFVGIDVSKATLDIALCQKDLPEHFAHKQFANTTVGCSHLLAWLKKQRISLEECFFIMEHTGWYTLLVCCFLQEKQMAFRLYSPLHLKRSLGLIRGKNDKIDAQRLAHFAFLHPHELQLTQLPSACLLRLKNLFAFRDRLIKTQSSLKVTTQDLRDTSSLIDNTFIIKQSEKQLKIIEKQVKETDFYGLSKCWHIDFSYFVPLFTTAKTRLISLFLTAFSTAILFFPSATLRW